MDPIYLVALACPIGMGLMMLLMGRGMMGVGRGEKHDAPTNMPDAMPADPEKRMALLQAQRQLLDAQIAAAEKTEANAKVDETAQ
jgi:uncharacterized protein YaiL (DUF2058 family)